MLALTRKTEYALIALCHLARQGRKVVSARDIAMAHEVPLPLLMNVLKKLNRSGFLMSVRGAHGGYMLDKAPREITLEALVEAVEGPVHLVRCVNAGHDARACEISDACPIRGAIHRVHERLRKFFSEVTIADLAFDASLTPSESAEAVAQ
jgi:Rrf2 family protein